MVKKQILDTIKEHQLLHKQQHIVLGLSGGPDSVCLFHVLTQLAEERGWTLHPVHINHQLRGDAADHDQAYTEHICQRLGWPCRTFTYDCNAIAKSEKITTEEAGRNVRYQAFAKVAEELKKSGVPAEQIAIAVAQNAEDQAETILFRVLRGAGVDGLSGIKYVRTDEEGNRIIRPLLDVKREDILAYCQAHNLHPRIDATNQEAVYTRNRLRLELIPHLEAEYNPSIKDTMIRMGKAAASDSDYLWQQAAEAYEKLVLCTEPDQILLSGTGLRSCHQAIRQRVLSKALGELGLAEDMTAAHFESCETIVFHQQPSARCDLPKGFYLSRVYDDVKVGRTRSCGEAAQRGGLPKLPEIRISLLSMEDYRRGNYPKDTHGAFDYDRLTEAFGEHCKERLFLGFRRGGDFIPVGEKGSKKIQDYFVDQKIPKEQRDQIPLLKVGREVLWILPVFGKGRFTSKYKLCGNTKNVICIEIIC